MPLLSQTLVDLFYHSCFLCGHYRPCSYHRGLYSCFGESLVTHAKILSSCSHGAIDFTSVVLDRATVVEFSRVPSFAAARTLHFLFSSLTQKATSEECCHPAETHTKIVGSSQSWLVCDSSPDYVTSCQRDSSASSRCHSTRKRSSAYLIINYNVFILHFYHQNTIVERSKVGIRSLIYPMLSQDHHEQDLVFQH